MAGSTRFEKGGWSANSTCVCGNGGKIAKGVTLKRQNALVSLGRRAVVGHDSGEFGWRLKKVGAVMCLQVAEDEDCGRDREGIDGCIEMRF